MNLNPSIFKGVQAPNPWIDQYYYYYNTTAHITITTPAGVVGATANINNN